MLRCQSGKINVYRRHSGLIAIDYVVNGQYSEELTADQRRSVGRRAKSIFIEDGEVFINKKGKKVQS